MTTNIQLMEFTAIEGSTGRGDGIGPKHSVTLEALIPYTTFEDPLGIYKATLRMEVSPELYEFLMKNGGAFPIMGEVK